MWAIKHDLVKLITYNYDCEDKYQKYDCPLCPDWYDKYGNHGSDEEEEEESDEYEAEDSSRSWREREEEDFERRPAKVKSPVKRYYRRLEKHFSHILLAHYEEIYQFLLTKQKLIPLPRWCRSVEDWIEGEKKYSDHQTEWIDKLTEDMTFLEHVLHHLSDELD